MVHCEMFQAGEIQAIIGDASRDSYTRNGLMGTQYCGVWSLTSKHRQFNAFGNSFAGLLPSDVRGKSPTFEVLDETTGVLWRKADQHYPVDVRATYQIRAPYYIDHSLTFTDREDTRNFATPNEKEKGFIRKGCSFREVSWCCYMNSPEDPRIHFLSGGRWQRYISPKHGDAANIAPAFVPNSQLEVWPERVIRPSGQPAPFHWDRYERRFDQPFYYGRLDNMVMILIFDTPRWLRFYCSPVGGQQSLLPGKMCPAWDFQWVIPESDYQVDREYTLRMRMVYKRFVSDDDVLAEVRRAQDELRFEKVQP